MFAMLAFLPLVLANAANGPLDDAGKRSGSCNLDGLVVCVQNMGGAGGAGGNASQPILCYGCTIQGAAGGSGGSGGNAPSDKKTTTVDQPPVSLIARCSLTIAGEEVVNTKRCNYDKVGKRFTLSGKSANNKYIYTIALVLNDNKTGTGSLSGGNSAATRPLGILNRAGACWVNDTVKVCAWQ